MGIKMVDTDASRFLEEQWTKGGGTLPEHEGLQFAESRVDDAFSTILQWLHWRIPFTRGQDQAMIGKGTVRL